MLQKLFPFCGIYDFKSTGFFIISMKKITHSKNFVSTFISNEEEDRAMQADYVIIGAGSAGCVVANKLCLDGNNSVVLLEAGPDNTALSLKMPAAVLSNLKSTKHNWAFLGEPEPQLNGRSLQHDRGKTLGGSSSINGMPVSYTHLTLPTKA